MTSPERLGRSFATLFVSQIRTTGLAIHREAALAGAGLLLACLITVTASRRFDDRFEAFPELLLATLPVALLLPWAIWRGDPAFGRAYLWTLPVRRQQAAAAKIAAGAVWLILILVVALAALLATAKATGGNIGVAEVRLVGPFHADPATAARIPWATPAWMWLTPFGAALTFYVASSAALLGLRHPLRWLGGAVAVTLLVILMLNMQPHNPINRGLGRFAEALVAGPWGLDFALTGGVGSLSEEIQLPRQGPRPAWVDLWRGLPTAGGWLAALAVWLGAALLALALALRRHWER
jgi:hypothetical protein